MITIGGVEGREMSLIITGWGFVGQWKCQHSIFYSLFIWQNGQTSLFNASMNGHDKIVTLLLKSEADVNLPDKVRWCCICSFSDTLKPQWALGVRQKCMMTLAYNKNDIIMCCWYRGIVSLCLLTFVCMCLECGLHQISLATPLVPMHRKCCVMTEPNAHLTVV